MPTVILGVPRPGEEFPLHPLHGMHDPSSTTPTRRPGSVRRTAHIDMLRPDGIDRDLTLVGHTRDIVTDVDGEADILNVAELVATIDFLGGRILTDISLDPAEPRLEGLIGTVAAGGFRAKADALAPELRQQRDPRYLLVDDIPVCTLISGHAVGASGALDGGPKAGYVPVPDQCAGFVSGGLLMTSFENAGAPVVVTGPVAPALRDPKDPAGWHALPTLPATAMRRMRRIDIERNETEAREYRIDAMFRDSYVRGDGVETVIHEYEIRGTVDSTSRKITDMRAVPRVLPWLECPGAVGSASDTVGMTLPELHSRVRAELYGTSTCTHLNDLYRSLGDCSTLIDIAEERT